MIKDLEKKDKAMEREDTDDLWTKIESLQWGSICYLCYKEWKYGCDLGFCHSSFFLNYPCLK
jgi:hypothetical protein